MTQDIDTYCMELVRKHLTFNADPAVLEVEGIIEALEKNKQELIKMYGSELITICNGKINFYKQALLKLRNE